MALTPEDVVNKRFQPTKFREGYDQDEVDDFLDEVVVELRRLGQENDELRQRLATGGQASAASSSSESIAEPAPIEDPTPAPVAAVAEPEPEPIPEPQAAPAPVAASVVAPTPSYQAPSGDNDTNSTTNLLQLARRLHEEHVKEGVEKRDTLVAEGHETAARIVSEAEAKQRSQIAQLDQERAVLQSRIDELRTFEREYRQKLKGYIEGQLRDLDASAGPSDQGVDASSTSGYQGVGGN